MEEYLIFGVELLLINIIFTHIRNPFESAHSFDHHQCMQKKITYEIGRSHEPEPHMV